MDWNKRPLEQWLEQYGAWLRIDNKSTNLEPSSPLSWLLDSVNGVKLDGRKRVLPRCRISDQEADAVDSLLRVAYSYETEIGKRWLRFVIAYYVDGLHEDVIASRFNTSEYAVQRDKLLGIVRLATKFRINSLLVGA